MNAYDMFGSTTEPPDDDANEREQDEREEERDRESHPERYGIGLCSYCGEQIDPEFHLCRTHIGQTTNIFASIRLHKEEVSQ